MPSHTKTNRRHFGVGLSLSALALVFTINLARAEDTKAMNGKIVEVTSFKLAAGVSDADFSKHAAAVNAYISAQKGFVSRRLSRADDGTYLDHVTWDSLADATAAMEKSMKEASLAPFMQSIDLASIKVDHQSVVASVN